jgi:hypothetical protein
MSASDGTLRVAVHAVGLLGPGLAGWPAGAAVLAGRVRLMAARTVVPMPPQLPAAERRRAGRVLRIAVAVAGEAAGDAAGALATVFTSSGGDGDNCHQLCAALATAQREISPTRFMNSVHNAASGYWSIAARSPRPATALCAHDGSFAAGLLEAAAQVGTTDEPVLLVAYDADYPEPLRSVRPIPDCFATALLLAPASGGEGLARLEIRLTQAPATALADPQLETLRGAIPAARSLPLLAALARGEDVDCVLDYLDDLRVAVGVQARPC